MASNYTPPGVHVSEVVGTNVTPSLAGPTTLCLVGPASGSITARSQITLNDGDADSNPATPDAPVPVSIGSIPIDATLNSVVEVRDAFSGALYSSGTDYTSNLNGKTITRSSTGAIADGTVVRVQYNYTPADYFEPKLFDSFQAIEERYGSAWSDDGLSIGSPLSHGALVAFQNGAPFVVLQPLFVLNGTTRTQPTTANVASASSWATTLDALKSRDDINVVVPIIGEIDVAGGSTGDISNSAVFAIWSEIERFRWYLRTQEQYVIAVYGSDGSAGVSVSSTQIINNAIALGNLYGGDIAEGAIAVSPAKFVRPTAAANQTMYVGGQYAAAAVAGRLAGSRVETSLTRVGVAGFTQVAEKRTRSEKDDEAANGVLVIEQRGEQVQIRHGITVDTSSIARAEISVVRAKHFIVESVYNTFENQIIGKVVADDDAPVIVRSAVIGTLERIRSLGVISRYSGVNARLLENDPTTVEVRFSYTPRFPINHVEVIFSVDYATGAITNVLPGAGR